LFKKSYIKFLPLCLAIILIAISYILDFSHDHLLKIHFIDVGYGDAIFIEMPDKTNLLIDSGHEKYAKKVMSYLSSRLQLSRSKKINTVILTHPHKDHFGNLDKIVEKFLVDKFYYNSDERMPHGGYFEIINIVREIIKPEILKRGDKLTFSSGDVELRILEPEEIAGMTNDSTIVAWLKYGETSILISSDIQMIRQDKIIRDFDFIKDSDFVQIPHHGGYVSQEFASFFNTKNFVMSAGTEYGKPFEEEVSKFKGKIYRTDRMGTIVIKSDGRKMWVADE